MITIIIFSKPREKEENFKIESWFLEKNTIYYDFSNINK